MHRRGFASRNDTRCFTSRNDTRCADAQDGCRGGQPVPDHGHRRGGRRARVLVQARHPAEALPASSASRLKCVERYHAGHHTNTVKSMRTAALHSHAWGFLQSFKHFGKQQGPASLHVQRCQACSASDSGGELALLQDLHVGAGRSSSLSLRTGFPSQRAPQPSGAVMMSLHCRKKCMRARATLPVLHTGSLSQRAPRRSGPTWRAE